MLDTRLQHNDAMRAAYGVRSVIAHQYGNGSFTGEMFWTNINSDLDDLESGCRRVIEEVTSQDVVFSENRRPAGFLRRW